MLKLTQLSYHIATATPWKPAYYTLALALKILQHKFIDFLFIDFFIFYLCIIFLV